MTIILSLPMPELLGTVRLESDPEWRELKVLIDNTFAPPSLMITALTDKGERWLADQGLADEMALAGRMAPLEELLPIVARLLEAHLPFEVSQTVLHGRDERILQAAEEELDSLERSSRPGVVSRQHNIERAREAVTALWTARMEAGQ